MIAHIERILPLIYTPTVGEACREFSHIAREPKGFFITPTDRGHIRRILGNWPQRDIRVIVVTDGQRILGLGDLGANGMGIPIGKLAIYTACAGIDPNACLPVTLDVGTNNEELRNDVLYLGYPRRRLEGKAYFDLVEEFVTAVQSRYPDALIQFEDFLTPNAYALLNKLRERVLCFNDDIQGTAAVALAGVYSSTRITGVRFRDLRIMFLGAGSAATGIADLMTAAFVDAGLAPDEARRRLVVRGRERPGGEGAHGPDGAQPVRTRTTTRRWHSSTRSMRSGRTCSSAPPALRDVHPGGDRADERGQLAAGDLRAVEPDVAGRVHAGAGVCLERRAGDLRERQPVRTRHLRRQGAPSGAGQQRVRVPRHRPGRRGVPRPHAARRTVPRGRRHAREPGPAEGSRRGRALPAAAGHPEDLAGHRGERRHEGLCDEA